MSRRSLQRAPIWLLAGVVIALGLTTTGFMAARAVADGRADTLLGAMLTPAAPATTPVGRRERDAGSATRIAESRVGAAPASAARW